jgi:predicted ATPase
MRDLPTGTVTLLFTDIEGSTRLLDELEERYADVLSEHRRVLRETFQSRGGVEVDTQGDAFFYAFSEAAAAVAAALGAQRALADGPVRVRIGVHTGEPIATEEGYVGIDVHRAARIMSAGHGGQVLVSQRTRSLVDGGPALRDLGLHRLKDLGEPEKLYQLGEGDFPPLKTLYQANLPVQPTALLGRERELAEAGALLREHRLLTLTGPGGSGKTRLALQLAAEAADEFPDGVFWVPLQAVRDPELVPPAIAETVGAQGGLAEFLGDKRLLILLDNLEQLLGTAPALAELLGRAASARFLVTSREPLRVAGEQRYPVEPLASDAAVELFVERARAIDPAFRPTDEVAEICRRLDNLPLAIELAAARISALSPDALLARLARTLPVLTGGTREAPERQRTLRATIAWSYDLLTPDEQTLFTRLAVFAGSFDLEAAEAVCKADLDTLQSLVDRNLVRRWASGRFGMLETIHEHASEQLESSGECEPARRWHFEYFLALARSANLSEDAVGEQRLGLVNPDRDNMRAALRWAFERDEVELALGLAIALEMFWVTHDPREGMRWYETLLEKAASAAPELRADALRAYGSSASPAGESVLAERLYQQSFEAFQAAGNDRAAGHLQMRLGYSALYRDDVDRARELAETSLAISRATNDRKTETQALGLAGEAEYALGDHAAGIELVQRSAELAGARGFAWWRTRMLRRLADWALSRDDMSGAASALRESLRLSNELGDRMAVVFALARLARIAVGEGRFVKAGRLWGAVEAAEARGSLGAWHVEREKFAAPVLAYAGGEFDEGRNGGRELSLEEAVEEALEDA